VGALGFDLRAEAVGGAVGLQGRFIGLRLLAWVLTVLFAAEAWAVLGVAYGVWERAGVAERAESGGWTPGLEVEWDQAGELLRFALCATLVVTALLVPVLVLFSFRALRNLEAFGHRSRVRTVWAVFGWFVPIANLFMPKKVVNEAWRGAGPQTGVRSRPPVVFLVWWASFLLAMIAARGAAGLLGDPETADEPFADTFQLSSTVMAIALVVLAISALAGIATFREVARRQHERADHLRGAAGPAA
jgi:hypothetical protein